MYETSDLAIAAYLMLHEFKLVDAGKLTSGKLDLCSKIRTKKQSQKLLNSCLLTVVSLTLTSKILKSYFTSRVCYSYIVAE